MAAAVAVAAILALTGGGGGGGEEGGDGDVTITQQQVAAVHDGLCAAAGHARRGEAAPASAAFFRVHTTIHQLIAAALSDGDESAGNRLNDQLLTVEDSFAARSDDLDRDLTVLVEDVADAARAAGREAAPNCP